MTDLLNNPHIPCVLIIEDDQDISAYFRQVMEMAGFHTSIAVNGLQALEQLFNQPPQIVLLDLSLPGITGKDILLILKTTPRFRHIRTVVITGYSQMANDLPVEPDLVLEKPVSPEQLTNLVQRLCQDAQPIPLPRLFETIAR